MEKVTTMNDFLDAQKAFKEIAIKFIKDNIAKCKNDVIVKYNDEEYKIVLIDNKVAVLSKYNHFLSNLSDITNISFISEIATTIYLKIRHNI